MNLSKDSVAFKYREQQFIDQFIEKFPDQDGNAFTEWSKFLEYEQKNANKAKKKYKWFEDPLEEE